MYTILWLVLPYAREYLFCQPEHNKHGKSFVKKSIIDELYAFIFLVISTGFSLAALYVDVLKSIEGTLS